MSKDKILIEFAIGKLAPRILKIHDENRAIFPFFFFFFERCRGFDENRRMDELTDFFHREGFAEAGRDR